MSFPADPNSAKLVDHSGHRRNLGIPFDRPSELPEFGPLEASQTLANPQVLVNASLCGKLFRHCSRPAIGSLGLDDSPANGGL